MSETLLGSGDAPAPQGEPGAPSGENPTPAPENPATPAPAPEATPAVDGSWISQFQGEDLGWLQNRGLQGKSAEEALNNLVNAQRNAEKRLGVPADRLITLPQDPTSEGAMDPVWNALGRPEEAAGYELDPGDTALTQSFAETLSGTFHGAGLSKEQGEAVYAAVEKFLGDQYDADQEQTQTERAAGIQGLQDKWGDTFELNIALAKEAAQASGASKEEIDALAEAFGENGDAKVIEFFNRLGQKRGVETSFISGDNTLLGLGATTPEAARARIQEMKADAKIAKDILGNNPDNVNVKKYRALLTLAAKKR